jgi:hypothetical protein
MTPKNDDEFKVRIDYPVFEATPPAYATNLVVQHVGKEFILNYYVVTPPAILGEPGEEKEAVRARQRAITLVPARCVARVVLTEDRMVDFVKSMIQNLKESGLDPRELGL